VTTLRLDDDGRALTVHYGDTELARYVYDPDDPQLESPRPYFHPLRTLAGDVITVYRPHDHVWHKGLALSLPNVGEENFWGGVSWVRGEGYRQLHNDGSMRHQGFDRAAVSGEGTSVDVQERLAWVTEQGKPWFDEQRRLWARVEEIDDAWVLGFDTQFVNVSGRPIAIGSPTTQGRPNAGYGGLFWRGPRSFTGGTVHVPIGSGGDELMGVAAPWLGFSGVHDGHGRSSTLVMVEARANPTYPTQWFVRSTPFAAVCPAPFFDTELPVAPGESVHLRYAVVIADGDGARAKRWAALGAAALKQWVP
jgi:hypothetical protein